MTARSNPNGGTQFKTATQRAAAAQLQWTKSHPLEGDGVITEFYQFLQKRNTKTLKACRDVLVPDTIVYDHNFPRGWFTSDLKAKEISKRQGKELDAASIVSAFRVSPNPAVGVVAAYISSYEEEINGAPTSVTAVEFFNERTLEEFVGRKVKREGILQKFVVPKGLHNDVIQAVWSPRVCIIQRRTNRGPIRDRLQCERDPYPVAVTYEGPSHYSEEGSCALHTTEQIKRLCDSIVQHFYATEGHKFITRMVLYFKIDEKDQVWLLWCGSLRVSDEEHKTRLALNLAPTFASPAEESGAMAHEDEELYDADTRHCRMTNDALFHSQYVKPHSPSGRSQDMEAHHADDSPAKSTTKSRAAQQQQQKTAAPAEKKNDDDWHQLPGIQDQYRELCIDREAVLSHFDDIFYEAYGHFLKHEPGPFNFEVERKIAKTLGLDVLQEMMQQLKVEHALSVDDGGTASIDDEELTFSIPGHHTFGPMTKLGDAAAKWIRAHYERRIRELREEAEASPSGAAAPAEEKPAATKAQPAAKAAPAPAAPAPAANPEPAPAATAAPSNPPAEEKPAAAAPAPEPAAQPAAAPAAQN